MGLSLCSAILSICDVIISTPNFAPFGATAIKSCWLMLRELSMTMEQKLQYGLTQARHPSTQR
jgi:hypothetical protein